jgi:hypothetical protein
MVACSVAGVALVLTRVLTRVSRVEVDADDVGCLPRTPSTFLISLGMVPASDVDSAVLTPIQNNQDSVIAPDVLYTTPDSAVGITYSFTAVSNQMHLSKVFPLNDNSFPPFILPLRFETAKVPAAPSTPVCPAKATAEEPCTPVQASRSCYTEYCEAARCSPLSRRSKALSQQLPLLANDDVVPVPGSGIAPLRFKAIEVPAVQAAPSAPVRQVKARGDEEPRTPIPVCIGISTSPFSRTDSIVGLAQFEYCIPRGCTMFSVVSFL